MLGEQKFYWIQRKLNGTGVVTKQSSRARRDNTKICKEPTQPNYLLGGRRHGTELSLSAGVEDTSLFLGLPGKQGRAQKRQKPVT